MDTSGPVYTKAKITVKYIMGCAIGMQLHSHGLVKAYVTDCTIVIHSHGLVKHVIEIRYHNLKTVMLNHKNDVKLFNTVLGCTLSA